MADSWIPSAPKADASRRRREVATVRIGRRRVTCYSYYVDVQQHDKPESDKRCKERGKILPVVIPRARCI